MQRRMTDPHATSRDSDTLTDATAQNTRPPAPRSLPGCMQGGVPLHEARALTAGGSVAHITLNDQHYVLRITRAGKLILTK